MRVWVVTEYDDCGERPVAAYVSASLADAHVQEMGGDVVELEIREALHPEVTDPAAQAERAARLARERRNAEERQRYQEAQTALAAACVITDFGKPQLCSCATYNPKGDFVTQNGYCTFCGGFIPETFRAHCGEDALFEAIDRLAHHDRIKMREIVGARRDEWPVEL